MQFYTGREQHIEDAAARRSAIERKTGLLKTYIDQVLNTIEATMGGWATAARNNYDTRYPPQTATNVAWRNAAFNAGGFASANNLRFPRVAGVPGTFGVYGNQVMTINWFKTQVALGAPVA